MRMELFDLVSLYFMFNLGLLPLFLKLVSYPNDSFNLTNGSLFKKKFYIIYFFIGILFFPIYGFFKQKYKEVYLQNKIIEFEEHFERLPYDNKYEDEYKRTLRYLKLTRLKIWLW